MGVEDIQFKKNRLKAGSIPLPSANPCHKYGIPSLIFFNYVTPMIWHAFRNNLQYEDLYDIKPELEQTPEFAEKWEAAMTASESPSLLGVLYSWLKWQLVYLLFIATFSVALQQLQPILLQHLLLRLGPVNTEPLSPWAFVFFMFGQQVMLLTNNAVSTDTVNDLQIKVRSALLACMYKKMYVLTNGEKSRVKVGQLVNYCSTDSLCIANMTSVLSMIWGDFLNLVLGISFLFKLLGYSMFASLGLLLAVIALLAVLVSIWAILRGSYMKYSDERGRATAEVVNGMKIIKYYGWEKHFMARILDTRAHEISLLWKIQIMETVTMNFMVILPILLTVATFAVYAMTGGDMSAATVFTALTYFTILKVPMTMLPQVAAGFVDLFVSANRLGRFLSLREKNDKSSRNLISEEYAVVLSNASFKFTELPPLEDDEETTDTTEATAYTAEERALQQRSNSRTTTATTATATDVEAGVTTATTARDYGGVNYDDSNEPLLSPSVSLSHSPSTSTAVAVAVGGSSGGMQEERVPSVISQGALVEIDVEIPKGALVCVVGSIGSGKSSLLRAILGEMDITEGTLGINIASKIAYCPQQAWIVNDTVKDNILFGKAFDETTYNNVIEACCLKEDFKIFSAGDETEIGERGVNLSGGQKQRISIARAAYSDADLILFDDPLSAVDAYVGRTLFENCFLKLLKNRTRVLVTHQLHFLSQADKIIFMKNGRVAEVGTYAELTRYPDNEFATLLSTFVNSDEGGAAGAAARSSAHGVSDAEARIRAALFAAEQDRRDLSSYSPSSARSSRTPRTPSSARMILSPTVPSGQVPIAPIIINTSIQGGLIEEEEMDEGAVSWKTYSRYIQACGGIPAMILVVSGYALGEALVAFNTWWLTAMTSNKFGLSMGQYCAIYVGLALCVLVVDMVRDTFYVMFMVRGSFLLHNAALVAMMRAKMSFFETTPVGRILARFTRDMQVIDNEFCTYIREVLSSLAMLISIAVVISIITPSLIPPLIVIAILFAIAQQLYRPALRETTRMDSVSQGPLNSHVAEAFSGLPSICAYNQKQRFVKINDEYIRFTQLISWNNRVVMAWSSARLEFLGALIVLCSAIAAVMQTGLSAAEAGLSLNYAMSATSAMQFFVNIAAVTESKFNSVDRLNHITEVEQEAPAEIEETKPAEEWPHVGGITFNNAVLAYRPGLAPALKGLSVHFNPREKIGIVGRTGAGKSSILVALFRIVELLEGSIVIDGLDISKIGLDDLRTHLAIIPQDPILFQATIRINLDPFNQRSDSDIWEVLERVHLKTFVERNPAKLNTEVAENGENLSVGQRQLMCLARAMLRKTKVLVLDEATASVDVETDELVQQTIRKEFTDVTMLIIAHRINTVIDCDRILVMDKGTLAEYDTPANLVDNPDSIFLKLVKDTGGSSDVLIARAKQSALDKQQQQQQQ